MNKFSNFVVKNKKIIFIISLLLLIPSIIGLLATKTNYDILVYLPSDIETLRGQNILKDDFIEDLKMSLLKDLEDNVHNINTKEYIMKLLSILIDHIDEKRDIYSAIFLNNRNGFLVDFLIDVIERESLERLKNNNDIVKSELPLDILVKFYAGGLINVCVSWLTRKEKYNKEELLGFIDKLIPEKI